MEKEQKQKIALFALAIILVFMAIYIGVNKYEQNRTQRQLLIYKQGVQLGYQLAVEELIQQAMICQPVPIAFENQTINLIAVECLQRQQQQQPESDAEAE